METLDSIYELFKLLPETKVWSKTEKGMIIEVCVSWENPSSEEYSGGYMQWTMKSGDIVFQFVKTNNLD